MKKFKIYFTSDLHGYVYPTDYCDKTEKPLGILNIINQINKDSNTLVIDGGDTIQGSPFTNYLNNNGGYNINPIAELMNAGGYDYITLGNHDFNYGLDYLKNYLDNLDAKCLCTNIEDTSNQLPIIPYDIKTLENGLKIGVIGFTTDFITRWEREENLVGINVNDTFSTISNLVDKVKKQCDYIIGIYHGGFEYDLDNHTKLSETSENIAYKICEELDFDILLTGHQHMPIAGQELHGTYIAQTPHNGRSYIELRAEVEAGGSLTINSALQDIYVNPHKEMYNKFLPLEDKIQQWLDTPVGFLDVELLPTTHIDMALNGSNLANFINQVQLDISNADISCTSFGNVIKGFDKDVTIRDIISTYVYPNTLAILEIDRNVLKTALERCASYFNNSNGKITISDTFLKPKVEHYNYDYFTNLEYIFDLNRPIGHRVTSIKFKGEELNDSSKLTLVMNNYRASGSGGYECYDNCPVVKEILTEMPEIIINYFMTHKNVVVDKKRYFKTIY